MLGLNDTPNLMLIDQTCISVTSTIYLFSLLFHPNTIIYCFPHLYKYYVQLLTVHAIIRIRQYNLIHFL